MNLGKEIIGRTSNVHNLSFERKFKALFGVSRFHVSSLWFQLCRNEVVDFQPRRILWALLFLNLYETEEVHARVCNVTEKTFRKWCWKVVTAISKLKTVRYDYNWYLFAKLYFSPLTKCRFLSVTDSDFVIATVCICQLMGQISESWSQHPSPLVGIHIIIMDQG